MKQGLISHIKVTVLLITSIAILILFAAFLWFWIDAEPVRNPALNVEDLPSVKIQSANDVEVVLSRPLFWQGRQRNKTSEAASTENDEIVAVSPLKDIKLLGIILTGNVRTALLSVEGKVMTVHAGQAIQGWTIDDVTAKEITFVAGVEKASLTLERQRPASIKLEAIK